METNLPCERIKVLLVDDHPVVRDGLRHLLESTPDILVVAEAGDGETACQLYDEHQPDVVVLDLSMPGIGGLETLRRIRAANDSARVLVVSMHDSRTLVQRALEAGAAGYLVKQSGMALMVDTVRGIARGTSTVVPDPTPETVRGNAADPSLRALSPREFQVFQYLAEGRSVSQIAKMLSLSPKTVGVHHAKIMKKLHLRNTAQLAILAVRCNVVDSL